MKCFIISLKESIFKRDKYNGFTKFKGEYTYRKLLLNKITSKVNKKTEHKRSLAAPAKNQLL